MSLLVFVFFLYTLSLSNNLTIMFVYSMKMASNKVDKKKKTYCPGTPNIGFLFFSAVLWNLCFFFFLNIP